MFVRKIINKRLLLVLIAVAAGLYCAYYLKIHTENNRPTEKVLVAKNDISPSTVVSANDVTYIALPVGSTIPNTIQDQNLVVGKKTKESIYKDEQILPQKLTDSPLIIEANEGTLGVPVDILRAVGMTIARGSIVDVYWIPKEKEALAGKNAVAIQEAYLVAKGAVVIDIVNKNNASAFADTPETADKKNDSNNVPAVAVLKFKDENIKNTVTAIGNGVIYLVKKQ